jgi:hypothetical protein
MNLHEVQLIFLIPHKSHSFHISIFMAGYQKYDGDVVLVFLPRFKVTK